MKRVLIFDLDDTLIPSTSFYKNAVEQTIGASRLSIYEKARNEVKTCLPVLHVAARNRGLYFKRMLEIEGHMSSENYFELCERYEKVLSGLCGEFIKSSETTDVLRVLSKNNRLAILTNENLRTQMLKLKSLDPTGALFSVVLTSEEVGVEKPHPKVFLEVQKKVNAKAKDIWMIGDQVEGDLQPAKALGWTTVHTSEFLNAPDRKRVGVDFNISYLRELISLVEIR